MRCDGPDALPGNPYDGHTLAIVLPEMEQHRGDTLNRILAERRLSRSQRAAPTSLQGLHRGPEAHDPAGADAMTFRGRAGHRTSQNRAPHGRNLLAHRVGDAINL